MNKRQIYKEIERLHAAFKATEEQYKQEVAALLQQALGQSK